MTGPRPAGCPWTLTDVDMLRKLLATGMKAPAIAQKMNRTVGAVQSRKSKLKQKLALSGIGGKVADQGAFRRVRPKLFQMSLVVVHGAAPLDPLPNREQGPSAKTAQHLLFAPHKLLETFASNTE
jgi:hypothetical protein